MALVHSMIMRLVSQHSGTLQIGYSSAELALEWLVSHPEEPATADAAGADTASKDEDEAVKKQLMASLGSDEVPQLEVCLPVRCQLPAANGSSAVVLCQYKLMQTAFWATYLCLSRPLTNPLMTCNCWADCVCAQAMLDESAETPSIQQLVDGSVATVAQMPAAAFPLADMLVSLCGQDSGKNRQQVFGGLVQHLKRLGAAQVNLLSVLLFMTSDDLWRPRTVKLLVFNPLDTSANTSWQCSVCKQLLLAMLGAGLLLGNYLLCSCIL